MFSSSRIIYLLVALSQIRIRRQIEKSEPERLTFKVWLFPYTSYLTIAGILAVLVAMALTPGLAIQFYISTLLFVLVVAAFFVFRRGENGVRSQVEKLETAFKPKASDQ